MTYYVKTCLFFIIDKYFVHPNKSIHIFSSSIKIFLDVSDLLMAIFETDINPKNGLYYICILRPALTVLRSLIKFHRTYCVSMLMIVKDSINTIQSWSLHLNIRWDTEALRQKFLFLINQSRDLRGNFSDLIHRLNKTNSISKLTIQILLYPIQHPIVIH